MQAAIFRKPHEPLTIESIDIDAPARREVLVRTAASGVCHSDLHLVDGNQSDLAGEVVAGVHGVSLSVRRVGWSVEAVDGELEGAAGVGDGVQPAVDVRDDHDAGWGSSGRRRRKIARPCEGAQ